MRRVEWMAVGWGGLIAGIGLVVAADRPGTIKLAVMFALFALAGYLAAVRAEDRRVLHAALGAVASVGFYMVFVAITWIIDVAGGPQRAHAIPAGRIDWPWHLAGMLAAAVAGGALAALRLRPSGERSRRRG